MIYFARWYEKFVCEAEVEADSPDEARELIINDPTLFHSDYGEFIEVIPDSVEIELVKEDQEED